MTTEIFPSGTAGLNWHKSSHSGGEGGECVEFAAALEAAHVRDSKDPHGPRLTFAPTAWTGFLASTTR
ncbi:DUF397 domain-containing protein [Streptomyces sp. SID3343]|uniref:DUF397 domain-containing protein n=1 Tax=Streptomyces sp. SID3343 TaxID=2690260 RepID=UPI001369B7D9|nr:DUF397 domain-containing protein [Streptomyces sp. SID3343]MYW04547.1 DUF397 domain-containing protein [Streptomyces sp. SID3343]